MKGKRENQTKILHAALNC